MTLPQTVIFFAFDALYMNGNSLLNASQPARKKAIEENIKKSNIVRQAGGKPFRLDDKNLEADLSGYFDSVVKDGYEGLLIKSMDPENTYYDTKGRT